MKVVKLRKAAKREPKKKTADIYIKGVSKNLYASFKARCARRGVSVKGRFITLMSMDVENDL